MRKELMLNKSLTLAWPEYNFLNSMIQHEETAYDWIMNTHIQIYGSIYRNNKYKINETRVSFYPQGTLRANIYDLCPFVRRYIIPRKYIINKYNIFSDFIIEQINEEYYMQTSIYESFRNDRQIVHPCYFYGYDIDKQTVNIVDNLDYGKYIQKEVSFKEINNGFAKVKDDGWATAVTLFKTEKYNFKNNIEFIADQIRDYLKPSGMCYLNRFFCPSEKYINDKDSGEVALGVCAYSFLFRLIKECYDNRGRYIDIRSFAFLVDHKKLMKLRNEYLIQKRNLERNMYLDSLLDNLNRSSNILLNLVIKYNFKQKKSDLLYIEKKLYELLEYDKKSMEYTLKGLLRKKKYREK